MTRPLTNIPRWLFLGGLVFAPWAYGCTRPWAIEIMDAILGVVIVLWLAGCAVRRRRPSVPWPLAVSVLCLLVQGWWMIVNAKSTFDWSLIDYRPLKQLLPFAPGVIDPTDSIPALLNDSAMLGALCFVADLVQRPLWRTRLWWTVALNGIALMLCGLGMKIYGIRITGYLRPWDIGWNSFAFYFYHGNAGAFINLILPLVAGLTAMAFLRPKAHAQRALWVPALLICVASSVAAVSKAAMVITLFLVIALAVWFVRFSSDRGRLLLSREQRIILITGAFLVMAAMISLGWSGAAARWTTLASPIGKEETIEKRLLASKACLGMIPDSGVWGFGPGSFRLIFPRYTAPLGSSLIEGIWLYPHEDYLQTIVEWGYVGAVFFAAIFFGGLWTAWRRLGGPLLADSDAALLTTVLIALAGIGVHALLDFPFQIVSLQLYAATYLGICWGSPGFTDSPAPVRRRHSWAAKAGLPVPATGPPGIASLAVRVEFASKKAPGHGRTGVGE